MHKKKHRSALGTFLIFLSGRTHKRRRDPEKAKIYRREEAMIVERQLQE